MSEYKGKNILNKIKDLLIGDKPYHLALNMLFIITIIIFIIFLITPTPKSSYGYQYNESIALSLLQSLQSAAAIYNAQEKKPPNLFTDFVTPEGTAMYPYTLSLENIDASEKIFNSKELTIIFLPDEKATYYLKGTDVTAQYQGF